MLVEEHLFAAEQVGAIYQLGIVLASSSWCHHRMSLGVLLLLQFLKNFKEDVYNFLFVCLV